MIPLLGKVLNGRYRVDEHIGRGGMAEVYRAFDNLRGVDLALKVLRDDLAEDKVFIRRFEREAKMLAALQHPSIVRFYGFEKYDGYVYLLMDFIQGKTLRKRISELDAPLDESEIMSVLDPVCRALHYAHQSGRVHCDVKSANILIQDGGKVFLTDFGIARGMDAATSTMVGIGTPAYMAPELIKGQDPTPQTDIYALGIVFYEMLTGGERPFTGERAEVTGTTAEKVRWEHLKMDPLPITQFNPNVSEQAEAVILKCLMKNPTKRFASALDLLDVVREPDQAAPIVRAPKAAPVLDIRESVLKEPKKFEPAEELEPVEPVQEPEKEIFTYLKEEAVYKASDYKPIQNPKSKSPAGIFFIVAVIITALIIIPISVSNRQLNLQQTEQAVVATKNAKATAIPEMITTKTVLSVQGLSTDNLDGDESDDVKNQKDNLIENCEIFFSKDDQYFCTDINGQKKNQIPVPYDAFNPSLSPDRKQIAFSYKKSINIMDLESMDIKQVINTDWWAGHLTWAPSGKQIAFSESYDVFIVDLSNDNVSKINTYNPYCDVGGWSPDGKQIVLTCSTGQGGGGDAGHEIFIYGLDNNETVQITNNGVADQDPSWAPDGKKIVFARYIRDQGYEIFVMNPDGSNPEKLTHLATRDTGPNWSRSGDQIWFYSQDGMYDYENRKIMIMDSDGSNIRELITP